MQQLIFESHPIFILLCAIIGVGYAFVLYQSKHPWSEKINRWLFAGRAISVFLISFLLVGPILKLINQIYEKPEVVLVLDNSSSLKDKIDSVKIQHELSQIANQLKETGYTVSIKNLSGSEIEKPKFNFKTSDINGALKNIQANYEDKNLNSIIVFTDGIYNTGVSPLYSPWRVPIQTVGLGDTIEHPDLILKNVAYNKIAYQGNQFPVRAEVAIQNLNQTDVSVSVFKSGSIIAQQKKNVSNKSFLTFDFLIDAKDKGIARYEIVVGNAVGESSLKNNRRNIFVDVVEGKKKILLVAPAPHPDIKALREVVEKNSNYEFVVHIPGISKTDSKLLAPGQAELVIFHQPFDADMKTATLYNAFSKSKTSLLLVIGSKTNLRALPSNNIPLQFESTFQKDEVTPFVNSAFHDFDFAETSNTMFSRFPPTHVPFGKFSYPQNAKVLLNQRIGTVQTDRPMLLSWDDNGRKIAVFIGEGLWRWRLEEYDLTEKTEVFDGTFSKLIQYLSTLDDKKKFKFAPIQNEFSETTPAIFEGQVYNDLFEKTYGHKIEIQLKDESGKISNYNYTLSAGGEKYEIGGLKEGSYQYTASTLINAKKEIVSGQFLVAEQNIEQQNLVADFGLLRKLATQTGGKFYKANQVDVLLSDYQKTEAKSLVHSEEKFSPLVQAQWFFFLILCLISVEWFLRKYLGSY
ncbi:MAG TPA: hypothetical protein DGG95_03440 [Cytophagales bacterium]|jgi:hypothetical protein|nr:hypothetical protein [Cytophagales bacterium]